MIKALLRTLSLSVSAPFTLLILLGYCSHSHSAMIAPKSDQAHLAALKLDPRRCIADLPNEPQVYEDDFHWNMSLDEIKKSADLMYNSEKRLAERAYYDESKRLIVLPNDVVHGGDVVVPPQFIIAVQRHIEKALERSYVDAIIFPDMGHSHFLVPLDFYKKEIDPIPVNQFNLLYQKLFSHSGVKVVYHTAEQLKVMDENKNLIDDKQLQWRYFTRNLVGHNNLDPDIELANATATSKANTLSEVSGYFWWGAGFNIHSSKNGCFSFKRNGQTYYFDLSLKDLTFDPAKH